MQRTFSISVTPSKTNTIPELALSQCYEAVTNLRMDAASNDAA